MSFLNMSTRKGYRFFNPLLTTKSRLLNILMVLGVVAFFSSCNEKESNIGLDLQDPSTIYNGIADTAYGTAYIVLDDSLLTTGLSSAIIGSGFDADIASTVATFYSNISTPNGGSVAFDENCTIDSVVLSLSISGIYVESADSSSSQDVHFIITQLAHRLDKDSAYYSNSEVELGNTVFYDDIVTVQRGDTMTVNLKLNDVFSTMIANHSFSTSDEFEEAVKGMHIRLASSTSNRNYVLVNLSASATRLTAYYTYGSGDSQVPRTYDFAIGTNVTHFSRFEKVFDGECMTFNTNRKDSLSSTTLYLSPLGGTNIRFNIDPFVRQFHKEHPLAIIHYAELVLPVDGAVAPKYYPDALAAIKLFGNGVVANIPDMYDPYTYAGFDGTYDAAKGCFRMRITQHLQDLINAGADKGTMVVISGRRTSWQHTVIKDGTTTNRIRVEFVYSE